MTTLEKEIAAKLRRKVERLGGWCLKWVCPGWSGVPDRIILLPGGKAIFAELKRPKGGVISPLQAKWREWLTGMGFTVWYIFDEGDLAFVDLLLRDATDEGRGRR